MKNRRTSLPAVALALIAVSLVALVAFADDKPAPQRDQKVGVHFISKPDDADLYVDGKFVGSTDLGMRLTPGVHRIEIRLDGYEPWQRELTVTPDNPTRVAARLKAQK